VQLKDMKDKKSRYDGKTEKAEDLPENGNV